MTAPDLGLRPDPDELVRGVHRRRRELVARVLTAHERDWRLYPGDGGDPRTVSPAALRREIDVETELLARLGPAAPGSDGDRDPVRSAARRKIKTFPVLLVSAPHIEEGDTGSFPGMPTPLLYATCVLDRLLRIDEFPGRRVPDVVAVLNPPAYSAHFEAELTRYVRTHHPVLVGISNLSEGHHYALRIAALVKRISPDTIILMGGQHEDAVNPDAYRETSRRVASFSGPRRDVHGVFQLLPDALGRMAGLRTLAEEGERDIVDLVFAGDASYAVPEVLRVVAGCLPADSAAVKKSLLAQRDRFAELPGTGQLSFYDDEAGRIISVPLSGTPVDGNMLPFIDVSRLTHENRFAVFGNRRTAQVMACLGCKYSCSFCHESADAFLYDQSKIRQRTPEHVMKEIRLRVEQGFEAVFFDDSTFTQNRKWVGEFLGLMAEFPGERPAEWGCQTTVNDVDRDLLRRMARTGCTYVYFGVESAEPDATLVQKVHQLRPATAPGGWADRFRQVAHWCREAGIRVGTSLQFGLGETHVQRVRTLRLIAELHDAGCIPDGCVALNINSPYPGTRQWLQLLKSDAPLPDYRERLLRHPAFETAHQFSGITGAEASDLYRLAAGIIGSALHVQKHVQEAER